MSDPDRRDESRPSSDLPFQVEIQRGHRAVTEIPPPPDRLSAPAGGSEAVVVRRVRSRGWWVGGALRILLVGAALLSGLAWWLGRPPAGALARVNDQYITMADVDREVLISRMYASLSTDVGNVTETRSAVLERLITQRVEAEAAAQAGARVTDADLDGEIAQLETREHWTPAQLDAALTRQGLSRADLRSSLHDVVLVTRYADNVLSQGARTPQETYARQNTWATQVTKASRVVRYGTPDGAQAPRPGASAPNFTLTDLDGRSQSLSALRGRPVLLNFWATWCQPCRVEMPILVGAYQQAHTPGAGLAVLAVAINSSPATLSAFRKEFALPFPVLPDTNLTVLNQYRVGPIPTSFLIDRQGTIRWVQVGSWSESLLQDKLALIR